jgi:hypothetical protein
LHPQWVRSPQVQNSCPRMKSHTSTPWQTSLQHISPHSPAVLLFCVDHCWLVAAHYKKTICYAFGLAVRIFPATMRTLTKDTALSEQGRGAAWHVWINARHGRGIAWARHAMCESAFSVHLRNQSVVFHECMHTYTLDTPDHSWR